MVHFWWSYFWKSSFLYSFSYQVSSWMVYDRIYRTTTMMNFDHWSVTVRKSNTLFKTRRFRTWLNHWTIPIDVDQNQRWWLVDFDTPWTISQYYWPMRRHETSETKQTAPSFPVMCTHTISKPTFSPLQMYGKFGILMIDVVQEFPTQPR